jgi:hypothetical protein
MLQIDEILEQIAHAETYPQDAIVAAEAQAAAITPHLLSILAETVRNPAAAVEDETLTGHLFAMFLLARFRTAAAYPLFVDMAALPAGQADALLGDTITVDLPSLLASVAHGNIAPLDRLLKADGADLFARSAALEAMIIMVVDGQLERDAAIDYLRTIFDGELPRDPALDVIWSHLVQASCELGAAELRSAIDQVFAEDLVDLYLIDQAEELTRLHQDPQVRADKLRNDNRYQLIDDLAARMSWWAMFQEQPGSPGSNPPEDWPENMRHMVDPPAVRSQQPGRNDPCPCGSGRKYKHCHGKA